MVAIGATEKTAQFELQQFAGFVRVLLGVALWSTTVLALADSVLTGRVVGLADGDTITVLNHQYMQHKVRVAGIDAPGKGQAFGNRSKSHLAMHVMGKSVDVEWHKKDRYGRIVGVVRVSGSEAGHEQVRAGMTRHKAYSKEQTTEDRAAYSAAKDDARLAHQGLWAAKAPQPPGDTAPESALHKAHFTSHSRQSNMPNIAAVLKTEIARVARKKLRAKECLINWTRNSSRRARRSLCR